MCGGRPHDAQRELDTLWGYVDWRYARNWRTIELADGCPTGATYRHAGNLPNALVFNGRSSPALKCPATTRPRGGAMDSLSRTLPNYLGFHESAGIRLHPRIHVGSFTCIVSRGEEENRSRHPHLAKSSHCTHALLFGTTMTAFPRNGHVLYRDLPTPYQLSGNNSWGSFLQSKTAWDRKIEARLCFTWSAGQKHSSTAQAQETRDASILMLLGPCTHATAPRAPASCQGSTFELVEKSDAYENIAQMVRACFSRFPSVGEMVRDSQ